MIELPYGNGMIDDSVALIGVSGGAEDPNRV